MTKPVLQTRCIGMKPHFSGHPLAPMEYVYECEEPPPPTKRRPPRWMVWGTVISLLYLAYGVIRALDQTAHIIAGVPYG